uniref:fatty acid amide hydrolase n=1 Tax=Steinernema glaseri TaxID=37863 RepID=A0A1I8APE8_9BILA
MLLLAVVAGLMAGDLRVILLVVGAAVAYILFKKTKMAKVVEKLEWNVARRLKQREEQINELQIKTEALDSSLREEINSLNYKELIKALQDGKYKCSDVLLAFQYRALKANEETNCVCLFITEATEQAKRLDELAKDPHYKKPPMFGFPISIKENIYVKGYDATKGYANGVDSPSKEDSPIIAQLKDLGAVPFVLTNVPQSMLSYTCMNPVYGVTTNPHDKRRTPGGSSGGESAIIGANGSLLGIGGDVGGSIRIPCHFTGIAGLKPSHLRLSENGMGVSIPGRPLICASAGPMAQSIRSAAHYLKCIWSDDWISRIDPYVPPVLWNDEEYSSTRKLKIGYYSDDGWFKPTPAMQRAVLETKEMLEKAGHTLVPFEPPNVTRAFQLFIGAVCVDGGAYIMGKIDNDLPVPGYSDMLRLYRLPVFLQRILARVLDHIYPRMAKALRAMPKTTSDLREIYEEIKQYRNTFQQQMAESNVDALICPVQVFPSVEHHVPMQMFATVSYTGLYNLLDYAAGTVSVTKVTDADEANLAEYPASDPWYAKVKEATKGSVGLPVGVQVVCQPYKEERCLRILGEIEDAIKM